MAIIERTPPEASRQALIASLPTLSAPSAAVLRQLPDAAPQIPTPAHPHPVYVLLLPEILAGRGLSAAHLVGWRYLLMSGVDAIASAEVNTNESETQHVFASMNEGRANQATLEATADLERSPLVATGNFELRLLRIPSLMTVAIWLHGSQNADIITPIPPANPYFTQRRTYLQLEWEAAMLDAARAADAEFARTGVRSGPPPRY